MTPGQNSHYHQLSLELLREQPNVQPEVARALDEREQACGVRFPAALREWYSLDGAAERWKKLDEGEPVPPEKLGEPVLGLCWPDRYLDGLAEGRLIFLVRYRHCLAVDLNEVHDSAVVASGLPPYDSPWSLVAPRFSEFVYSLAWWFRRRSEPTCYIDAPGLPMTPVTYAYLRHSLQPWAFVPLPPIDRECPEQGMRPWDFLYPRLGQLEVSPGLGSSECQ